MDRRALEALGRALVGPDRPLVAAFATMAMKPSRLATEDDAYDAKAVGAPRGASEDTMRTLASLGIRTSIIRLPPGVHGAGDHAFAPRLIQIARKKRESAYVGDDHNRWPAVHRIDAARLFRLALEKGPAGATYHGVAEEGVPFREIAELIGRVLNVPVVSKSPAEAARQFSDDFIHRQHLSKDLAERGTGGLLQFSGREDPNVKSCGAITQEENAEIADGPRSCLATDVGSDTCDCLDLTM